MAPPSADPIFENVDLQRAIGYEYKEDNGQVYGPFPALAYFTWSLKGLFPPTKMIRLSGRREFHPLLEYATDILLISRIQLTNVLLRQKEWFYLDKSAKVQGPFQAEQMLGYIQTRFFDETAQFLGRPIGQGDQQQPLAESNEFRNYGDLLNETLTQYRMEIQQWREETYGRDPEPVMNGGAVPGLTSGSSEGHSSPVAAGPSSVDPVMESAPPVHLSANSMMYAPSSATEPVALGPPPPDPITPGQPMSAPLPILSPVPPQPASTAPEETHIPIPMPMPVPAAPTFEQLKRDYEEHLRGDRGFDWWLLENDTCYGPYSDLSLYYPRLQANSQLGCVQKGEQQPTIDRFYSFETLLRTIRDRG